MSSLSRGRAGAVAVTVALLSIGLCILTAAEARAQDGCTGGLVDTGNGHCCWPGQAWSTLEQSCIGQATCPAGTVAVGIGCAPDQDNDTLVDAMDKCPSVAEDLDGFQDEDGCPEPDNDNDGICEGWVVQAGVTSQYPACKPGRVDDCPVDPEDIDGFEDDDGCPDLDNDGDAVADVDDQCPNDPEDLDGIADLDGCAEDDADSDGVLDDQDRCPTDAEDMDGFEDDDGCQDEDNDGDGLKDELDQCPLEAEDIDGLGDDDGCPETDIDGDGIADADDQCPLVAEDDDGYGDSDGCPEEGSILGVLGWVGVVGGISAAGSGIVLQILASSERDSVQSALVAGRLNWDEAGDQIDTVNTMKTAGWVLIGVGAGLGIAGAIMLIYPEVSEVAEIKPSDDTDLSFRPLLAPLRGGSLVGIQATF